MNNMLQKRAEEMVRFKGNTYNLKRNIIVLSFVITDF